MMHPSFHPWSEENGDQFSGSKTAQKHGDLIEPPRKQKHEAKKLNLPQKRLELANGFRVYQVLQYGLPIAVLVGKLCCAKSNYSFVGNLVQ